MQLSSFALSCHAALHHSSILAFSCACMRTSAWGIHLSVNTHTSVREVVPVIAIVISWLACDQGSAAVCQVGILAGCSVSNLCVLIAVRGF